MVVLSLLTYGYISLNNEQKVYKVAFWPHQRQMSISGFEINYDKNYSGGLFVQHHFKIEGKIKGEIYGYKGRKPYIKGVQISEKLVGEPGQEKVYMDIYPIIEMINEEDYNIENTPFEYTFTHTLNAYKWSENTYVINCLGKEQTIIMVNQK